MQIFCLHLSINPYFKNIYCRTEPFLNRIEKLLKQNKFIVEFTDRMVLFIFLKSENLTVGGAQNIGKFNKKLQYFQKFTKYFKNLLGIFEKYYIFFKCTDEFYLFLAIYFNRHYSNLNRFILPDDQLHF